MTPGQKFRQALADESPLQIPGAINANHALLALSLIHLSAPATLYDLFYLLFC